MIDCCCCSKNNEQKEFRFLKEELNKLFCFKTNKNFKEFDIFEKLINTKEILLFIDKLFPKNSLDLKNLKLQKHNDIFDYYYNCEKLFINSAKENNINKITIEFTDKPDLILTFNDEHNEKIGIELVQVFPYFKDKKFGDVMIYKQKIIDKIFCKLSHLDELEKYQELNIKIMNGNINFENLDFKTIEEVQKIIKSVKNWEKLNIQFYKKHNNWILNKENNIDSKDYDINNFLKNLKEVIKTKNKKINDYITNKKNTILLIIVDKIEHIANEICYSNNISSSYTIIENKSIQYFVQEIERIIKERNNSFFRINIIFKNTNIIKII